MAKAKASKAKAAPAKASSSKMKKAPGKTVTKVLGKPAKKIFQELAAEERLEAEHQEEIYSDEDAADAKDYATEDDDVDPKVGERMIELADKLDSIGKTAPRRKVLHGTSKENVFAAVAPSQSKVSLADLLGEAEDEGQLKRRLARLESEKTAEIAPPPSKTQQDRAERALSYQQATNRMDDWEPLVAQNRRQKLSFPLNEATLRERPSLQTVVAKPKSGSSWNDAEREIMEALKASGLASEKQVLEREDEALKALGDEEESKKRHAELAKLRMLMFYSEQKSKRVKKIKSKTFRRLRKKRMRREEEEALERLKEDDPEAYKEYEEKQAMERAKERMDLRKKNTSKNVREMHLKHRLEAEGIATDDPELAKRMRTIRSDESDEDESDDDEDDELTAAERHLMEVEHDLAENDQGKGLMGLKFMQRAAEREKQGAVSQAKRLVASLKGEGENEDDEQVQVGRRSFANKDCAEVKRVKFQEEDALKSSKRSVKPLFDIPTNSDLPDDDDEEIEEEKEEDQSTKPARSAATTKQHSFIETKLADEEDESNPWLAPTAPARKETGKKSTSSSQGNSTVVVSVKKVLEKMDADEEDVDEDEKERREGQKELIRMAFADVIGKDFTEEQRKKEEEEQAAKDAKEGKTKLVGWGSWTGLGVPEPRAKKQQKSKAVDAPNASSSSNVPSNVIVSKRTNKLQKKYQVEGIPYPFTSREQYERSLTEPIGPEWNTFKQFERKVQPEVKVKPGAIIEPLKMTSSLPKKKKKMAPNRKNL